MADTDPREIQAALAQPFAPEDLEWRIQRAFEEKESGLVVPYVTNRAIQNRLDDVVGPDNWYNDYKPWHSAGNKAAQICGISIHFEDRGWITKWDGAEDSDIEPIKGGLSDSMKRAAVHWGIGRVLYNMDTVWADIEKRGKTWYIKSSERAKLDKAYQNMLSKLNLVAAAPGGTQAQLTPKAPKEGESNHPEPQPAGGAARTASPPPPKAEQPPAEKSDGVPALPDMEYVVQSFTVQQGMSAVSTVLTLLDKSGKKTQAFARGRLEDICEGAYLYNVKLVQRRQDTVVFNVLEHYEVITGIQQAA